jgi:hypothetical protein
LAKPKSNSADPTIIDGPSLFEAAEIIAERFGRQRVTVDYPKLKQRLDAIRREQGWRPASSTTIMLSLDPASEAQQRFWRCLATPDLIRTWSNPGMLTLGTKVGLRTLGHEKTSL